VWALTPVARVVAGSGRGGRLAPVLAAAIVIAVPLVARATSRFDARNPLPTSLLLAVDAGNHDAAWAGHGASAVDEWTARTLHSPHAGSLGVFFGGGDVPALLAPAPFPALHGPEARTVVAEGVNVEVVGRAEAGAFALRWDVFTDADVRRAEIDGAPIALRRRDLAPGRAALTFVLLNPGTADVHVKLTLARPAHVTTSLVDVHYGFPAGVPQPGARPADVVPEADGMSDVTLVRRALETEPAPATRPTPNTNSNPNRIEEKTL
jgi:hypothetical protein